MGVYIEGDGGKTRNTINKIMTEVEKEEEKY